MFGIIEINRNNISFAEKIRREELARHYEIEAARRFNNDAAEALYRATHPKSRG